ncbi:MAG: MFS transporter [Phenylobacterium sp.]|uniref:MFS transporter n=1 Tax=Phenylobacterium sp. TaxID=1871053 RepID=UPI002735D47D|nr:MFS transporter [Phenylobacterium sp.]MDP3750008.1 MFS transporter [Phenylobacterium sp.]
MNRRDLMVVGALLLADILSTLEQTMVFTAMPTITREFDHSRDVLWLVTGGLLMGTMTCALAGRLGDLYGRSRMLLVVMGLACLGSTIAALAPSLSQLIAGTTLQGAGNAILPLALAVVRERFPTEKVPFYIGVMLTGSMVGALAGLLAGGLLVDNLGWQSIYFVSAGYAVAAMLAVGALVGVRGAKLLDEKRVAMICGALFAPAIAMLLFAITRIRDWGITDWRILSLVVASALIGGYWVRHQLREAYPLINLRLAVSRELGLPFLCISLIGLGTLQHTLILSMFLQQPQVTGAGLGLTATLAGYALMPVRVVGAVSSPAGGHLVQRLGVRAVMIYAALVAALGWLIIGLFPSYLPAVLLGAVLEGAAGVVVYAAASTAIVQAAPPDRIGEAAGLGAVMRAAMVAVGSQVIAQILATWPAQVDGHAAAPSERAYLVVFGYIGVTLLLMVGVASRMRGKEPYAAVAAEAAQSG